MDFLRTLTSSQTSIFLSDSSLSDSETEWFRLNTIHWGMRELWQASVRVPIHHPAVRILDVGCGSGIWVKELAEVLPRARLLGVDLSPVNIPEDPARPLPENMGFEVHLKPS
jgi:2-polyprenyl-3-methyl-5-hydroxy-6-metoxy-1,4-benzoquinol methylase